MTFVMPLRENIRASVRVSNIRDILNHELKLTEMSSSWWLKNVRGILIAPEGGGVVKIALNHVPEARDCHLIGLSHGQCVEVRKAELTIQAIFDAMERCDASINNCGIYVKAWPPSRCLDLCIEKRISRFFYSGGNSSVAGVDRLRSNGIEVQRLTYAD